MITTEQIIMLFLSGGLGMMWWQLKRYITKIEDVENRVIKLETVMSMLGDIREDVSSIKTDVEVIKAKGGM